MILEHAVLGRRSRSGIYFRGSLHRGKVNHRGMQGFEGLTLSRRIERPGTYLLLVKWHQLSDHTEGFRKSK